MLMILFLQKPTRPQRAKIIEEHYSRKRPHHKTDTLDKRPAPPLRLRAFLWAVLRLLYHAV